MYEGISVLFRNNSTSEQEKKSPMQVLEELVNSTVENTLALVLGERVVETFYSYLQRDFGLKQEDVFARPEFFSEAVDRAFGKGGDAIHRVIISNLCRRAGIASPKTNEVSLASTIETLKRLI